MAFPRTLAYLCDFCHVSNRFLFLLEVLGYFVIAHLFLVGSIEQRFHGSSIASLDGSEYLVGNGDRRVLIAGGLLLVMVTILIVIVAVAIVMVAKLSDRKPLSDLASPKHLRDLGTLMFAFVMLWAYFSFSQWLIIWAGDLPEENSWYLSRIKGGWGWIALAVILFHFVLPFSLLLSRQIKRRAKVMMGVAIGMLFMRLVDLFWIVTPAFGGHGSHSAPVHIHWMDLAAPIGIGGLWLAFFAWQLKGKSLTPIKDPGLEEVLASAEGH